MTEVRDLDGTVIDVLREPGDYGRIPVTQITNTNAAKCYRRSAVQGFFRWPVNYPNAGAAFFSRLDDPDRGSYGRIIYDRTDNWEGLGRDEGKLLSRADIVICSSRWLFNDTRGRLPGKKVFYVPNASYGFKRSGEEKHTRRTAIYAGKRLAKVDTALLVRLAMENPGWDFEVYTEDPMEGQPCNVRWSRFVDDPEFIFREAGRCHAGLCLLRSTPYTRGMLPDKVFLYGNAGIPCVYSGIPDENVEEFGWCTRELDLDKVAGSRFEYRTRTWNDVCAEIKEIIADENGRYSVGQD